MNNLSSPEFFRQEIQFMLGKITSERSLLLLLAYVSYHYRRNGGNAA